MIYETQKTTTKELYKKKQKPYLAIFGDDVKVVAREVDITHILDAMLKLGEVEAYTRARAHTHKHTHTRARTHTSTHTHTHTHTHTYTHIHTHTHTSHISLMPC